MADISFIVRFSLHLDNLFLILLHLLSHFRHLILKFLILNIFVCNYNDLVIYFIKAHFNILF